MNDGNNSLEMLDDESAILNKRGWFLVTYYQCRKDKLACASRDRAIAKAESISRKTALRVVEKEEHVKFEVWEYWK